MPLGLGGETLLYSDLSGTVMDVANAEGQRVGSIIRLRDFAEPQQDLHHFLNLPFLRTPIPHDAGLDFQRGVFADGNAGLSGGEKRNAAHVPQLQGTLHIGGIEHLFDRNFIGRKLMDERGEPRMDFLKASGKRLFGRGLDCTKGNNLVEVPVRINNAETGSFAAAIDAENSHVIRLIVPPDFCADPSDPCWRPRNSAGAFPGVATRHLPRGKVLKIQVPQRDPSGYTARWAQFRRLSGHRLQVFFFNVKIRVDLLDVFMVFQLFHEPQHLGRVFAVELDVVLWDL